MIDAKAYGPLFGPLLAAAPLNELGPGRPDRAAAAKIKSLAIENAFAPRPIVDQEMSQTCLAGLYLMYDCFDESHAISQAIETPTGSYWHGILHRREPDYGNAKYWFRRVGRHPVFEPLAVAAQELAAAKKLDPMAAFLRDQIAWDPFRFVDLCETAAAGRPSSEQLCRQIQRSECELLFEYCFRQATAAV